MKRSLIVLAMLLLAGFGCGAKTAVDTGRDAPPPAGTTAPPAAPTPAPTPPPGAAEPDATDPKGEWKLLSLKRPGEDMVVTASFNATATFKADGTFSAYVCNNMSGSYVMEGNRLVGADIISTKKFCAGAQGEVEASFQADLAAGVGVARNGETLLLLGATGNVYSFAKAE